MLVVRCCRCGTDISTDSEAFKNSYREELSDTPCGKCLSKPRTVEDKLLDAIWGIREEQEEQCL